MQEGGRLRGVNRDRSASALQHEEAGSHTPVLLLPPPKGAHSHDVEQHKIARGGGDGGDGGGCRRA